MNAELGLPEQARETMSRASLVALWAVTAAVSIGIATWVGYHEQSTAWDAAAAATPQPDAEAGGTPKRASRGATTAVGGGIETAAAPGIPASAPRMPWPLWEFQLKQPVPPRDPPLTPLPWRLIGATQTSGAWQIVVVRQGKAAPEFFKKGDSLPGGYRIDSITEEDVTLIKSGRPVILSYIGSR